MKLIPRLFTGCVLLLAAALCGPPSLAGTLLVSGDSNIIDTLPGGGEPLSVSNEQFFVNLLGGGNTVLVLSTTPELCCLGNHDQILSDFYASQAGVSSSLITGPVTAASLSGGQLFVAVAPENAFAASEVTALSGFLVGGGSVFLLGDNAAFTLTDSNVNALLAGLGSGMQIVPNTIDGGAFFTAITVPNALTAGVTALQYAATSTVSGGTPLFLTNSSEQPFIAVEAAVPEPSSLLMLGTGLGALGLAVWRRKK